MVYTKKNCFREHKVRFMDHTTLPEQGWNINKWENKYVDSVLYHAGSRDETMVLQENAEAKPGWGGPLTFNFIVESLSQTVELCKAQTCLLCVETSVCRAVLHLLCVHAWPSKMSCLYHLGFPCPYLRKEPGVFPLWMKLMRKESRETGYSLTDYF